MAQKRWSARLLLTCAVLLAAAQATHAQIYAPAPELGGAAKLISFTGQVSVLRDSAPWALNLGDLVQPLQVVVTGSDGFAVFQVADGSKFEVYPRSKVVFRANRGDWRDLLEVWLGKVRVQIEHLGGLPNNNRVRTPTAVISVRGTVFDVEIEDEDATTLVLVEEGRVEVARSVRLDDVKILNPGEWLRVYKNAPIAMKMIDRGSMLQRAAKAASEAFYQVMLDASRSGAGVGHGGATGGTGGSPGDQDNNKPPPGPPPPPPH